MPSYYVTHPNLGISAMVDAPATEKARTTFLDFLERTGQIGRADRQYWRRNMVAERMEDPYGVQADVELHYGYEDTVSQRPYHPYEEMAEMLPEERATIGQEQRSDEEVREFLREAGREDLAVPEEEPQRPSLSPIARKALGGYSG